MFRLKAALSAAVFIFSLCFLVSCDTSSEEYEEEESYIGAFEEIEKDGNIRRERRLSVVKEIIKTSKDDPNRMEIDTEKLGIE